MSDLKENKFELSIRVSAADIDDLKHVSNIVYVRWVQEVAVAHWKTLASVDAQREIVWVVLRHEIDYKSPALLNDEITVRTWVGNAPGLTFERHTEIERTSDRQLLVRARTVWCPISTKTGRPTRVNEEIRQQFSSPYAPEAS
jgi:acyl-CoA thioester hydrolase